MNLLASPARVAQVIARRRPPCPIFADCRVDHLAPKKVRRG